MNLEREPLRPETHVTLRGGEDDVPVRPGGVGGGGGGTGPGNRFQHFTQHYSHAFLRLKSFSLVAF